MLDIKILASSDHLEIKGVIPQEFVAIAQTWGCLPFHAYIASKQILQSII